MALLTRNGFTVGRTAAEIGAQAFSLPGTDVAFPAGIRAGEAATLLGYAALQWHVRMEPLHPGWCWGFSFRPVRGSTAPSEHSAGTAVDLNAPLHPLGKRGTLSPDQLRTLRTIVTDELDGTVRAGAFYEGRVDEMHLELAPGISAAKRASVAARIAGMGGTFATAMAQAVTVKAAPTPQIAPHPGADGALHPGMSGSEVAAWQDQLWRLGFGVGAHDGNYGPATEACTLDLQRAAGGIAGPADGIAGTRTQDAARNVPTYPKSPGPELPLAGPGAPHGTVLEFQRRLDARGWRIGTDGTYGPETARVLGQFQADATRRGFSVGAVDGIGGPATWTALWLAPVT